ncbi:MAG: DUF177 domain-containing protein [Halobacteriovoraceae bacterium]|nr:DUF177 domain-containing protein [Halobacteriovoraceae bacterium]MCB9094172.1 DUF177 domain-containing protein [Halobacteriovoraceae bacterium]
MKNLLGKISFGDLVTGKDYHFDLDKSEPWVLELLTELNENSQLDLKESLDSSDIQITVDLIKKNKPELSNYILMKASVSTHYNTTCVKTLTPMKDSVEIKFQACFLMQNFESDGDYKEETDIYVDNEMYELYFEHKHKIDIAEAIHEQIYLNYNYYPES